MLTTCCTASFVFQCLYNTHVLIHWRSKARLIVSGLRLYTLNDEVTYTSGWVKAMQVLVFVAFRIVIVIILFLCPP